MRFEDHFSKLSGNYAQYRPGYPPELFTYLASISPGNELAWDCGTGNGQAAVGLAAHFDRVYATDASPAQIELAIPYDKVDYRVEQAEKVSLPSKSCDLVTSAVAVHWFDFDAFYAEVRRVLKPGGIIAVWTYHLGETRSEIDEIVLHYYQDVLAGYWPERIVYLDALYQTLPFPFTELSTPSFHLSAEWDLDQLAGFLVSWSASQRYYEKEDHHPLSKIWDSLFAAWGPAIHKRLINWPLFLRVGKV